MSSYSDMVYFMELDVDIGASLIETLVYNRYEDLRLTYAQSTLFREDPISFEEYYHNRSLALSISNKQATKEIKKINKEEVMDDVESIFNKFQINIIPGGESH